MYFIYVRNSVKDQWQMLEGRALTTYEKALDLAQSQTQYWRFMYIVHNGKEVWAK